MDIAIVSRWSSIESKNLIFIDPVSKYQIETQDRNKCRRTPTIDENDENIRQDLSISECNLEFRP